MRSAKYEAPARPPVDPQKTNARLPRDQQRTQTGAKTQLLYDSVTQHLHTVTSVIDAHLLDIRPSSNPTLTIHLVQFCEIHCGATFWLWIVLPRYCRHRAAKRPEKGCHVEFGKDGIHTSLRLSGLAFPSHDIYPRTHFVEYCWFGASAAELQHGSVLCRKARTLAGAGGVGLSLLGRGAADNFHP